MSKRLKLSDLAKVVAQKAATSASKGVVLSEGSETTSGKRALDDGSKGKQAAQLPESKKAKIDIGGASEAPARPPIASGGGSSVRRTLGQSLGPQASVMASATTAEKILAGVILPADKKKVDRLTFDQVVTKFLHVLGQGVILGFSLAVRSRDFAECALNQKAVAESVEMEMVRAQNQAIELEGALAEEKAKGKKLAEDADARDKYPDLGVDVEDVEMDHELLAKEEAEAEKRAAEEGASGDGASITADSPKEPRGRSTAPFISSKTILGDEESEHSLPSWISDHLGGRSYIDETNQSPSFPPVLTNSPKMDTSSLNKESNVMSQAELDNLGATYSFPPGLSPNAWRSVICSLVIWRHFKRHMSCDEFRCLYSLSPLPDSGWCYFKARPEKNLLRGSPSNVKGWKTRFFFCLGGRVGPLLSPDMRFSGKSCNKLPTLSEVDAKRTETVFGKIEPGGYFEVSKVLGSRTFRKYFAVGCTALSTSGGDNATSGDDGEFVTCEDSVEYLGVIRRGIRGAIRRALPGIPDETLLRWLGGKVGFRAAPELRSDAISARVGAPALGEKTGGKAKAEKAVKATTAKPPTKGVVIREKRSREGDHVIEIGEPDSSKGKEVAPPPPPKRFKSNRGAINARGRAAEAGTSSPGGIGSESMMSDASVARRLLTRVIPASDKKEVDGLSENELVAKSFHALGQVVVFASSLALRSQEHLHDIDFHMARADSAELELVKAQKRAVKAENRLVELSEEGSKPGTEVDDLKATVAELTNKLAKAKELAIEDFKASGEFKAAVTDSAATYFSEEKTALWLWASSDEYSDGGSGELSGDDLARFHGLVLPRSKRFGDSVWHSNVEMEHRINVWRCPLSPLGRGTWILIGEYSTPHQYR
ncbi:hypothetical protein Acr_04g0008570 [Actinidia rufa]|uniref:Uncharacterized protein n=1 Tax=Actinidia rufa TaxID=165716 RepID=A0A7J0EJJ4_9ERIC|nr:hypothetical protein Acr_04g0008570 [Actinidia rufa]